MWLESHGNLARHPKTRRLMQRMGWTLPATIGNLHLLWYWALEYAPTGDLTKFDPDQLTHDLDLGDATPEQFLEALIDSGFIDSTEEGSRRLHDWPEYTAKSLRPKFRRNPDRWHQVLHSYGLPVVTRRTPRRDRGATVHELPASSCASRSDQMVEYEPQGAVRIDCSEGRSSRHSGSAESGSERNQMDFQAVRRGSPSAPAENEYESAIALKSDPASPNISQSGLDSSTGKQAVSDAVSQNSGATSPHNSSSDVATVTTEQQMANMRRLKSEVPRALSLVPGFVEKWWPRLLDMYENRGTPLDPNQRRELLARLCMRPYSTIKLIEHCIKHALDCKWEHLPNTS